MFPSASMSYSPVKGRNISEYRPRHGKILIKIPSRIDKTKSGLYIDTTYMAGSTYNYQFECGVVAKNIIQSKEGQYLIKWGQQEKLKAIVRSEVSRVPRKKDDLSYGADRYNQIHAEVIASSVPEIQKGDIVYFGYLTVPDLRQEKRVFFHSQEDAKLTDFTEYAALEASRCYFRIRDGKIAMLNDYVLASPIVVNNAGKIVVEKDTKFDSQYAIVAYASENSELKAGDKIVLEKGCDAELEYELNRTLPEPFFCLKQESEILAIVE